MYRLYFTKQAQKDALKIKQSGMKPQVEKLLALIAKKPFHTPPPVEKLLGDLAGAYSRRINLQHRLVYQEKEKAIKIIRMWTHYK